MNIGCHDDLGDAHKTAITAHGSPGDHHPEIAEAIGLAGDHLDYHESSHLL